MLCIHCLWVGLGLGTRGRHILCPDQHSASKTLARCHLQWQPSSPTGPKLVRVSWRSWKEPKCPSPTGTHLQAALLGCSVSFLPSLAKESGLREPQFTGIKPFLRRGWDCYPIFHVPLANRRERTGQPVTRPRSPAAKEGEVRREALPYGASLQSS